MNRRTSNRARQERIRRQAGSAPIAVHLAIRRARRAAIVGLADAMGVSADTVYRRIRSGIMRHPADEGIRG